MTAGHPPPPATAPTGAAPAHPPPPTPRDWRAMTRHDFDDTAPPPVLFDLEPAQATADDGCGTGDLFELLEP